MPGEIANLYKCPDCNTYVAKIERVKAGTTTDLYYLRCEKCLELFELRYFQLQRI